MKLKSATLLLIVAIIYIFILRTIGTIIPFIFLDTTIVKVTEIIALIAGLISIYFFVCFKSEYIQEDQTKLKMATTLIILIFSLSLFTKLISLLHIFNIDIFYYPTNIRHAEAFVPWAGALIMLFFFVSFYNENFREEQQKMKKVTSLAIIGSSALVFLYTITLINYFYFLKNHQPIKFIGEYKYLHIIGIIIIIFYFITSLIFFMSFYKAQEQS